MRLVGRFIRRWSDVAFRPVDASSLAIFRIVFGLAVAVDAWRYLAYGWVTEYYIRPQFQFTYLYLDFVRPWPGKWMLVHFWVLSVLALLAAAGVYYRLSSALLFLAYAYVFLLEQAVYMNHQYLMSLLSLLLACMPAARAYSVDHYLAARRAGRAPAMIVPRWCVDILRFQLAIVYLYGAIAKLNQDWLRGEPMYSSLVHDPSPIPAFARWLPAEVIAYGIAWGGVVADFAIPLLLFFGRTFWPGFFLALVFHGLNAAFLHIGVFSYLMTGAILIFLPPDWPRRVRPAWERSRRLSWVRRPAGWMADLVRPTPGGVTLSADAAQTLPSPSYRSVCASVLGVYVVAQLAFPLRHFLYPGPVSWTEEGHRFSWHMKLRQKHSVIRIHVTDPATGRSWQVDPANDLTPRQRRKVGTFPDMLLQYVHFIRDRLRREGIEPVIRVEWMCALNGRSFYPLVDPEVNLAAVERTWRPASWILPLPD